MKHFAVAQQVRGFNWSEMTEMRQ